MGFNSGFKGLSYILGCNTKQYGVYALTVWRNLLPTSTGHKNNRSKEKRSTKLGRRLEIGVFRWTDSLRQTKISPK